jgi:hypothetical protein
LGGSKGFLSRLGIVEEDVDMNAALNEQIAPEIVQAILAQAAAQGLSVNVVASNVPSVKVNLLLS